MATAAFTSPVTERLPEAAWLTALREPTGEDEIFVLEHRGPPAAAVLGLAFRLWSAPPAPGSTSVPPVQYPAAWQELPAVSIGSFALQIRRAWLGDLVRTESVCAFPECGQRVDVAFSISAYLAHHRPRRFRGAVTEDEETSGWLVLTGTDVRFRIPTIADLLSALDAPDPEAALAERCVRPPSVPFSVARRVDRVLTALAPSQAGEVTGTCPECGHPVSLRLDPISYALAEFRAAAAGLYEQVWLLASGFGWPEREILLMPRRRRAIYCELARHDRRLP